MLVEKRQIIKILFIAVLIVLFLVVMIPLFNAESFRQTVQEIGPFGPLIVIFYAALTQIFAPVAGSPTVAASFAIYGVDKTILLYYIASLISGAINFFIARRYGRGLVTKLVGPEPMKKVDDFISLQGTTALILVRLFGSGFYDFVSYAMGLTNIPFKKYYVITIVFGGIANFILRYVYRLFDFTTPQGFILWYGFSVLLSLLFLFVFGKVSKKRVSK